VTEIWFLHGFTGSGGDFDPLIAAMQLHGRDRWAPSLIPGDGEEPGFDLSGMAALVADLARRAAPRVALVGYSMGGRIALSFAVAHPDRVEALALIGATAGIADPDERAARSAADEALAARIDRDPAAFADAWEQIPILASQSRIEPVAREALRRRRRARSGPASAACLRGLGTGAMPPLHDRLERLTMPVLVIAGEEDVKFRTIGDSLASRIANARRWDVPGAGHSAHLERPEIVGPRISAFLDEAVGLL
jgi:2-succinyl-6-hydroxy-2,4-cyclohexadiene-1-carboxylate synthase